MKKSRNIEERFLAKIRKENPQLTESQCIEWLYVVGLRKRKKKD